jgi:ring-1,2-phenylacetyl-CoA epoxidase subunit PaaD
VISTDQILDVLREIPDPEMPISIVDLGIVGRVHVERAGDRPAGAAVSIDILPTFVGCPALEMIARSITQKVGALSGVARTDVRFVYDPPWTVDRISAEGRASLAAHGVTVPERGSTLPVPGHHGGAVELTVSAAVRCPFCGSDRTAIDSMFGPTRCRMIYYCPACRNSFEHLKQVR